MLRRTCQVHNLLFSSSGTSQYIDYQTIWRYQKALLEHIGQARKAGHPVDDVLLLVQHPSVYTLGRGATLNNLKFVPNNAIDSPSKVHRIERGGEVTWHGPGQMVCYPLLDLHKHKKDLHWYTTTLEETVIQALDSLHITSGRSKVNTGVWIGSNKVCAIGVTASRWVTMHGLALNVTCDLTPYSHIIPCGITQPGCGVTNLIEHNAKVTLANVADKWLQAFAKQFDVDLVHVTEGSSSSLEQEHNVVNTEGRQGDQQGVLRSILARYPHIANAHLDTNIS